MGNNLNKETCFEAELEAENKQMCSPGEVKEGECGDLQGIPKFCILQKKKTTKNGKC